MLSYHDSGKTRTYGICILEYGGQSRATTIDAEWLNRAFSDKMGIARYFRKMSGGRQFVEWEIFIPNTTVMPISQKVGLKSQVDEKKDTWIEIGFTREAAARNIGIPLDKYPSWIWIIDDAFSTGGTTARPPHPGDIFVGALDLSPNRFCHEMTHSLGLFKHASTYPLPAGDYGDNRCVMGDGIKFENVGNKPTNWLITGDTDGELRSHSQSGPGICAPYLNKLGWLDLTNYISIEFSQDPLGNDLILGPLEGSIFANQGTPPVGSDRKIAINISRPSGFRRPLGLEYWIEYRIPEGFDRGFGSVPPREGTLLLRKIDPPPPFDGRSFLMNSTPALLDEEILLPDLDHRLRVTGVDIGSQRIDFVVEKHYY